MTARQVVDPAMRIDVWSDVICPWCYLGDSRLLAAIDRLEWGDEIRLRWRAFQLDPGATAEPQELRPAIERKYGPGSFDAMTQRLTALGAAEGLDYRFDLAQRVGTVDAHRLLVWAAELDDPLRDRVAGPQTRLATRLFRSYFTEGGNVADHDTLLGLVDDAGLDPLEAKKVLVEDLYRQEVAEEIEGALERNVTGVPAFVIEDAWMIPGAQEVDTLVTMLERARTKLAPAVVDAEVCDIDDPVC
jgi:predicted DsbA family dithiol-disulfide isomerase